MIYFQIREFFSKILGDGYEYGLMDYFAYVVTIVIGVTVLYLLVKLVSPKDSYIKRLVFTLLYTCPFIWLIFMFINEYATHFEYFIKNL